MADPEFEECEDILTTRHCPTDKQRDRFFAMFTEPPVACYRIASNQIDPSSGTSDIARSRQIEATNANLVTTHDILRHRTLRQVLELTWVLKTKSNGVVIERARVRIRHSPAEESILVLLTR